ncbi:uncharacterized protein LOC132741871 [Ruditapes philippinarum]|uniref:uncharacterized protein LOC132741871 n=1 Tax=Ruditapes philippinarum TaxID=129788 RepID=UPI00295C07BA|nr:uncharacterized protein LOC132741871 [Ruditapes philippinarum]
MALDDPYDYMQHINRNDAENPKEPTSHQKNTKMSDVLSLRKPNLKRDNREADDIHCHLAKQQTSGDQVRCTQRGSLNMNITDVCQKSQATGDEQISEKLVQDDIRNELADKKKTKKGFFTNVFRTVLACFGIRNDRKDRK